MYPANAMLQKVAVGKVLSCSVILWGTSVTLMGATQNFAGLMVLRFIMGCFEAPLFPCITLLNSMWYTKKEQPSRTAISFAVFSTVSFSKPYARSSLLTQECRYPQAFCHTELDILIQESRLGGCCLFSSELLLFCGVFFYSFTSPTLL